MARNVLRVLQELYGFVKGIFNQSHLCHFFQLINPELCLTETFHKRIGKSCDAGTRNSAFNYIF